MRWLAHIASLTLVVVFVVACDDGKDLDASYTDYRYDLVTYLGPTASGTQLFQLVGRDDAPSVT
ncbi:MAG: hypothetical protein II786_02390, partial [Muribaculaceae bacterium]|nr:hypothetical protein [Muribaculaceae bacterium]